MVTYADACAATMDMSEKEMYEEALWYKENLEKSDDVKVYKLGSIMLVNSGAAFTSVNDTMKLRNLRHVGNTRLEYADRSVGAEM